MDHDDDGETSYNTFVDDVAFEPTYLQALLTAAGRNVATVIVVVIGWIRIRTLLWIGDCYLSSKFVNNGFI